MNTFSKLTLLQRISSKAGKSLQEKKIYEVILLYINLWGKENFRVTSLLVCENWARRLIFIKRVLYFQYFAINFQFVDKLDNNLTPRVAPFKINWLPLNKDVERLLMMFLHEYTCQPIPEPRKVYITQTRGCKETIPLKFYVMGS